MATINYTQTDTTHTVTDNCSGSSNNAANAAKRVATDGGAAGTGTPSVTVLATGSNALCFYVKCTIDSTTAWNSGTWTWRINVTTANMNITLTSVYICRIDSSDVSQAIIGSSTGLSVSFGSTGVKSGTISGSAQTPNAGDYVMVVFLTSNGAMTDQAFNLTPNQNIDSPFTLATTNLLPFCIAPQGTR